MVSKFKLFRRAMILTASALALMFLLWIVLIIDPLDWGGIYSSKFTWKKFELIKIGESIDAVVQSLGQPIHSPGIYRTNMPGGVLAECGERSRCELFKFSGTLFIGGREANIIVSKDTRRVIAKWVNREP